MAEPHILAAVVKSCSFFCGCTGSLMYNAHVEGATVVCGRCGKTERIADMVTDWSISEDGRLQYSLDPREFTYLKG